MLNACILLCEISTDKFYILEYCEIKYNGVTADKLKRDLTSKCGEECRKLQKEMVS